MYSGQQQRKQEASNGAIDRLVRYLIYIYIYLLLSAANELNHVLSLLIVNGNQEPFCNGRKGLWRQVRYLHREVVVLHTMYTYLDEQDADAIVP